MSAPNPHPPTDDFKRDDPHHEHDHDHGHTIVSWKTLVGVLAILLAFTALTVSAAQGEKWIASAFDVILPDWMNVAVAMSIATVKGILVMAFFMQLRYDDPFNTIIMLFCFLAFSLFLGFTSLDLMNRNWVDPWKMAQISPGGMGMAGTPLVWKARENVATRRYNLMNGRKANGDPLAPDAERAATLSQAAIAQWQQTLGADRYDAELLELTRIMDRPGIEAHIAEHGWDHYNERLAYFDPRAAGHASHASHGPNTGSSADRTRPRIGLSGALSTQEHDDRADHGDGHGDAHADDDHPDEAEHAASELEHTEPATPEGTHRQPETGPDAAGTPTTPPTTPPATQPVTPPH